MKGFKAVVAALLLASLSACSTFGLAYESIPAGKLKGKLIVRWIKPDLFVFTPDKAEPLTFTRFDGSMIIPQEMVTDGGSIPRPMWVFRSYSPWGYAPAFIVHDWMFRAKRCSLPEATNYTLADSASAMAEVMKTMMEAGTVEKDSQTIAMMHAAVTSRFAQQVWDDDLCLPVPSAFNFKSTFEYVIEYR
jgi:hypothetical protein